MVMGVAFMLKSPRRVVGLCADIPAMVTNLQNVRVVDRYIEARPNRMHETFLTVAADALMDAWPCKK
jgi:hypothetical protein